MKGFFTQGIAVLLDKPVSLTGLKNLLPVEYRPEIMDEDENGEVNRKNIAVVLPDLPEALVILDVFDKPWPDHMGSPDTEPDLFSAWGMGYYGPFTFPGSFERAVHFAKTDHQSVEFAKNHNAFIRVKTTYPRNNDTDPIVPQNYNPIKELMALTAFLQKLLDHLPASIYFNPAGELLLSKQQVDGIMDFCNKENTYHLSLWTNSRLYNWDDDFMFMDSVGNEQFDLPDIEVIIPKEGEYDLTNVSNFINDISMHSIDSFINLEDEEMFEAFDGTKWEILSSEKSLTDPPRNTIRLYPEGIDVPSSLIPSEDE